jgi:hypothetical protein
MIVVYWQSSYRVPIPMVNSKILIHESVYDIDITRGSDLVLVIIIADK